MKEKLIIKNFGPIKSVELDLGRFNILIGEQATGKSTVAKVLAVCRYFSYIIDEHEKTIVRTNISAISFLDGLAAWGLKDYMQDDSFISYQCKHYSLEVEYNIEAIPEWVQTSDDGDGEVVQSPILVFIQKIVPISSEFRNLLSELEKIKPKESDFKKGSAEYDFIFLDWVIPTSFFLNDVKNVLDNPFYLRTERGLQSIFSIGQSSIQNLSDSLFNQFARLDQIARMFKKDTFIEPLNIYYQNRDGHGYIRKANETRYYSLFNAASGYQAIIPIVLVIKYYTEVKKRSKTLLIEEPEQNLFPNAQSQLMQYLVDKTINFGNSVLLTTQSPYILTSLNNMMYAYQVGQKNPGTISAIIEKKYWINPEDVSAYRLLPDGTAKNILDEDIKQINAGELDEISRSINENWDKIADVEYSKHEN